MSIYWADFREDTTGGAGTKELPWGWTEFGTALPSLVAGDRVRILGVRDSGGTPVLLDASAAVTLEPWDRAAYGPWGIRTTADCSLADMTVDGAVVYCRDFWSDSTLHGCRIECSRRVVLPHGVIAWLGCTIRALYVDWNPCATLIQLAIDECDVQTEQPGTAGLNTLCQTAAANSIFRIANSKSEWYDSGSAGYTDSTWYANPSNCRFEVATPAVPWTETIHRASYCLPWVIRDLGAVGSGSYGTIPTGLWGEPRTGVGAYVFGDPRHYPILRALLPDLMAAPGFAVGDEADRILWCDAKQLDIVDDDVAGVIDEMFPETCRHTIADWERVYALPSPSGTTLSARRAAVAAADLATGGLARPYFESIAAKLGYGIGGSIDPHLRIVENAFPPFRADFGRADIDRVYDQGSGESRYTVQVFGTNVETDTVLQSLFNRLKTHGTTIVYINE